MLYLNFLNIFFHTTHVLLISFVLVGWAFKRRRPIHLAFMILTLFSWVGLGFFFGWGYCFWTDWHWQVRDEMGLPHPASYIKLLADSVSCRNWNAETIDLLTASIFLIVLATSVYLHFRDRNQPS